MALAFIVALRFMPGGKAEQLAGDAEAGPGAGSAASAQAGSDATPAPA
jgi:hypothetical protein